MPAYTSAIGRLLPSKSQPLGGLDFAVSASLRAAIVRRRLPCELYRSPTWDRGRELADHQRLTSVTDVDIYFCDPRSPMATRIKREHQQIAMPISAARRRSVLAQPSSAPSQDSSTSGRERPCSIRSQLRSLPSGLQRSVEVAAQSGREPCSDATDRKRAAASYRSQRAAHAEPSGDFLSLSKPESPFGATPIGGRCLRLEI
jgi:hypothetical protein